MNLIDPIWHHWLRQPYQLATTADSGTGQTVVLLHGIGRSGGVWRPVVAALSRLGNCRVVAYDLLGFGASPKPGWSDYTVDDHASSVIHSLLALHSPTPMVLVGHSMGCLVAVRVAHRRPDLVKQLILYEIPLYDGLPDRRTYRLRLDLYFKLFEQITQLNPTFNPDTAGLVERLARRVVGAEINADTWQPFIKSLQHTIMEQTAAADIRTLDIPMDVIYGSRDMLVLRGKVARIFGTTATNITVHTIRERHVISPKASQFLVDRIVAALRATTNKSGHSRLRDILRSP
ncbi:MAG: alpha/beta hydrolase [Candidatus Saccharibacteria bacterium]